MSRRSRRAPLLVRSFVAALVLAGAMQQALAIGAAGRPAFKAGDAEAYWIWFDDTGWHLRGTAGKAARKFHGVLRADGGVSALKASRPGTIKNVELLSDGMRFDFDVAKDGVEGFDWQQTADCVTFEVKLDEKIPAKRIFIGARAEIPEFVPFRACRK